MEEEKKYTLHIYLVGLAIVALAYCFAFHEERSENQKLKAEIVVLKQKCK